MGSDRPGRALLLTAVTLEKSPHFPGLSFPIFKGEIKIMPTYRITERVTGNILCAAFLLCPRNKCRITWAMCLRNLSSPCPGVPCITQREGQAGLGHRAQSCGAPGSAIPETAHLWPRPTQTAHANREFLPQPQLGIALKQKPWAVRHSWQQSVLRDRHC